MRGAGTLGVLSQLGMPRKIGGAKNPMVGLNQGRGTEAWRSTVRQLSGGARNSNEQLHATESEVGKLEGQGRFLTSA